VEPEYPPDQWLAGKSDIVAFDVVVDSSGMPIRFDRLQGGDPFLTPARQALEGFRFTRPMAPLEPPNTIAYKSFDFEPTMAVYSIPDKRVFSTMPQVLVSYPCQCARAQSATLARIGWDMIAMQVDTLGCVRRVRFPRGAPPDSLALRLAARRWRFRPFVAAVGAHAGRAVPIWAAVEVVRTCGPQGVALFARPDTTIDYILGRAYGGEAMRLRPAAPQANTIGGFRTSQDGWVENCDRVWHRATRGDTLRTRIAALLAHAARSGSASVAPGIGGPLPEPAYAFVLWAYDLRLGSSGTRSLTVTLSPAAKLITARTEGGTLFLSYRGHEREVESLLSATMPPEIVAR